MWVWLVVGHRMDLPCDYVVAVYASEEAATTDALRWAKAHPGGTAEVVRYTVINGMSRRDVS